MWKAKIKTVIPYWLSGMLVLMAMQTAVFLMVKPQEPQPDKILLSSQPMVLGAAVDIRGQETVVAKKAPIKKQEPDLAKVTAQSYLVYDTTTGEILAEKNSSKQYSIASLTKLMTALVAYDYADLNGYTTMEAADRIRVSPVLALQAEDEFQGWDLFNAMLVGSANDAAASLARYVSGVTDKNFVDLMNEKAKELNMASTRFSNPLGFDSRYNYSTAEDLKKLVDKTQAHAAFTSLGKKTAYNFTSKRNNNYHIQATNKLVGSAFWDVEVVKTGYTQNSKGAMISKVKKDGRQITVIVLSSQDREKDTIKLSEEVFAAYEWR